MAAFWGRKKPSGFELCFDVLEEPFNFLVLGWNVVTQVQA